MYERAGLNIGDVIDLQSDYKKKTYKIVGIVNDARYICDSERGVNSLGNGSNTGYLLMLTDGNSDIAIDDALFDLRDNNTIYSELRITLKNTDNLSKFSSEYEDYVENYKDQIETIINTNNKDIYKDVIDKANKKIDDANKEYEDGLKEYNDGVKSYEDGLKEYNDGVKSYEDGLKEYNNGLSTYNKNLKTFNTKISDAQKKLDDGEKELKSNEKTINSNKKKVDQGISDSNAGLKQLSSSLAISNSQLNLDDYTKLVYSLNDETLTTKYNTLLNELNKVNKTSTKLTDEIHSLKKIIDSITIKHNDTTSSTKLTNAIKQIDNVDKACNNVINYDQSSLNKAMQDYMLYLNTNYQSQSVLTSFNTISQSLSSSSNDQVKTLQNSLPTMKSSLTSIQSGLKDIQTFDDGYASYVKAKNELETSKKTFNKEKESGQKQLDEAKTELDNAKKELNKAKTELTKAKQELDDAKTELTKAKQELDDAKVKIADAKEDIKDISEGEVISLTSKENAGIVSFDSNSDAIQSISLIFPLIFFLVAALVSLTTMTRMVEEQRVQSGTLRALGYSKKDVIYQYMIYAFLATFFACGLGIVFGTYFFPFIIYTLYSMMMYNVGAKIQFVFDLNVILQTYGISVAVTLLVTFIVCYNSLKEAPASLLRPKAPKLGKRILLEKITFIWKRLSFNQKVTMRNIFRYKKRFFMSVIGIAGCTALIITGFGVKYSVSTLADKQYGEVWLYNAEIGYSDELNEDKAKEVENQLKENNNVKNVVSLYSKTVEAKKDNISYSPSILVPDSLDEFKNIANLKDSEGNDIVLDDSGVYIDLKLSELLDVKKGDEITFTLEDKEYKVKVNGIFTLYFTHNIIMSKDYYQNITNEKVKFTTGQVIVDDSKDNYQQEFTNYTAKISQISSVSYIDGIADTFRSMMSSLNSIILILIVCAGMLAFVVLYNLTNINIQERKTEIATIKVLGFYPKEVYDYVFRENIFIAVIGSILGMLFGYLLHGYLIRVVEIDLTHFIHSAGVMSYIYAVIITMVFTYLINFYMRRVLRKIDMVESLKSIE
jgi:putative ABC transport system permease protein